MEDQWSDHTRFGIGLFALLDPFVVLPYVLGVSAAHGGWAVRTMAFAATATIAFVLLTMHVAGEAVLTTLGTSLPSFQIGGGLIILLSGLALLADPQPSAAATAVDDRIHDRSHFIRLGVAPLGIPMLAGAGSITKVVIETNPGYGLDNDLHITAIILLVCLITGAIIASASVIMRLLGNSFLAIMSRLAGLVIVAVAVEIMVSGVAAHTRRFLLD